MPDPRLIPSGEIQLVAGSEFLHPVNDVAAEVMLVLFLLVSGRGVGARRAIAER